MTPRTTLLAGLLSLACSLGANMPARAELPAATPAWVVVPSMPGDNLPPSGRSLFDQLFAVSRGGRQEIDLPWPFTALLGRIERELIRDPASNLPPIKPVLIPLGRSLQRTAAAPDYFSFPRIVIAVDGENRPNSKLLLKDRLYIGYQEKSSVLEVISYNESAGRFEFQLVKDYRAGGKPQVYYANRNLCFSCHQNGSPIFSRALWDETNANPQVANLLTATGRAFYGLAPQRGVDIPYAIDNATERANGFALTQRLWQEACGANDLPARRCRAGLFVAALRHALSGGQRRDADDALRTALQREALRRWPGGLATGNPDLPNRNPLEGLAQWPSSPSERIARSHVAARFDPLLPRTTRSIWHPDAPEAMATAIAGLAEFVSASDRQALLAALARQPGGRLVQSSARCRIEPAASRWSFRCSPVAGQTGPTLNATLARQGGRLSGGTANRLTLPGGTALTILTLDDPGRNGRYRPRLNGQTARTNDGHALDRLTLTPDPPQSAEAELSLTIRQDFASIEQAVAALVESDAGESLFGPRPFPRRALFAALLVRLGEPTAAPCCLPDDELPPPRLEVPAVAPGSNSVTTSDSGLQDFYPYCAACHQSAESFPPNFLSGSATAVSARLRQCAPRLYVRLAMADIDPAHRTKTPMPPESMLPAFATDVAGWKDSPARKALLAKVGEWLRAEIGQPPDVNELLAGGYEALRPCLPTP